MMKQFLLTSYIILLTLAVACFVWKEIQPPSQKEPERPAFEEIHYLYNVGVILLDIELIEDCEQSFIDRELLEKRLFATTKEVVPQSFKDYVHIDDENISFKQDSSTLSIKVKFYCSKQAVDQKKQTTVNMLVSYIRPLNEGQVEYGQTILLRPNPYNRRNIEPGVYSLGKKNFYQNVSQMYKQTVLPKLRWLERTDQTGKRLYLEKHKNTANHKSWGD
ncbi:MAG: hypothetical protein ACQEQL_02855 [Pseudomonadota bacterium]